MGVDVMIAVRGCGSVSVEADKIKRLRWELAERGLAGRYLSERDGDQEYGEGIVFSTLDRYYGDGYERGHWPTIYAIIQQIRHMWPDCTVEYYGDCSDSGEPVSDASLADIWRIWIERGHFAYRRQDGPECCGGNTTINCWSGDKCFSTCSVCGKKHEMKINTCPR